MNIAFLPSEILVSLSLFLGGSATRVFVSSSKALWAFGIKAQPLWRYFCDLEFQFSQPPSFGDKKHLDWNAIYNYIGKEVKKHKCPNNKRYVLKSEGGDVVVATPDSIIIASNREQENVPPTEFAPNDIVTFKGSPEAFTVISFYYEFPTVVGNKIIYTDSGGELSIVQNQTMSLVETQSCWCTGYDLNVDLVAKTPFPVLITGLKMQNSDRFFTSQLMSALVFFVTTCLR